VRSNEVKHDAWILPANPMDYVRRQHS
jgi:hypothetical protein